MLEKQIYLALIKNKKNKNLKDFWNQMPKSLKNDPVLIKNYTLQLIEYGDVDIAFKILQQQLQYDWQSELLACLPLDQTDNLQPILRFCENSLIKHPQDFQLLFCLGIISEKMQLWGKASDFLQQSTKIKPMAKTYHALGRVKEHLGEPNAALNAYRKGLSLE